MINMIEEQEDKINRPCKPERLKIDYISVSINILCVISIAFIVWSYFQ